MALLECVIKGISGMEATPKGRYIKVTKRIDDGTIYNCSDCVGWVFTSSRMIISLFNTTNWL